MQCLLIGNYGDGNYGDEVLRAYFLERYPQVQWKVLQAGDADLPRLPSGIRSFIGTPWWKTIRAYRNADAVVFGGGTLWTDSESWRACVLWWMHAALARLLRRPIFLAFQGIGPFRQSWTAALARQVVRWSSCIILRDTESFMRIKKWNMGTKCVQSFDPVLSHLDAYKTNIEHKNCFIIIPRKNSPSTFTERVVALCAGRTVRILSFEPDDAAECAVCLQLSLSTGGSVEPIRTTEDLVRGFRDAGSVITQRFHGAIAALAFGVPVEIVPYAAGDKLQALGESIRTEGAQVYREQIKRGEQALEEALRTLQA